MLLGQLITPQTLCTLKAVVRSYITLSHKKTAIRCKEQLQVLESQNILVKKMHNSCENTTRVISLDGTGCSFHSECMFEENIISKNRDMSKVNPFPNMPLFLCVCSTKLLKTWWEKEKLLVTSNFSLPHSVFYPSRELYSIFMKSEIVVY